MNTTSLLGGAAGLIGVGWLAAMGFIRGTGAITSTDGAQFREISTTCTSRRGPA